MYTYKAEQFTERGRSVHVFQSRTTSVEKHTHDFIEIVYILSGKGTETVDGRSYDVRHGDMVFVNYGSTHSFSLEDGSIYINICFFPETVSEAIVTPDNAFSLLSLTAFNEMNGEADCPKISFFGEERKRIEDILKSMLWEYKKREYMWNRVVESYLNVLVTLMIRKVSLGVTNDEMGETWHELADYIDENYNLKLTLSALAEKCFYNPSYFSRVFKEKFGMSVVEYITRKRLEKAMELLTSADMSIDDIAYEVGFSDRSSFYHAFAKYIGGMPSDYRPKNM